MENQKKEFDYVIEGKLRSLSKIDFNAIKLAVIALVKRKEVGRTVVDENGNYKLSFKFRGHPFITELRVIPDKFSSVNCQQLVLSKLISHNCYKLKKMSYERFHADIEFEVSKSYIDFCRKITKTYRMDGTVYSALYDAGGNLQTIQVLPGAKLDFFEIDKERFLSPRTEDYLGTCYSGPDGSYEFDFDFSYGGNYLILKQKSFLWSYEKYQKYQKYRKDVKPDIQVRISQFHEGFWQQVHESPIDWDIEEIVHRDFFIPTEDLFPPTISEAHPDQGFQFITIGLIPIDNTRIIRGYATTQPYDPVSGISHQPFCDTLRIFGLFATNPPIVTYKVEYACADKNGPIACINENAVNWQAVTDPLRNLKWNDAQRIWDSVLLGPDQATGRYQNIDTDPEWDWCEHALKLTWRTRNLPNGYYTLRITGYDQADTPIGPFYLYNDPNAVLRIDNTKPETSFEVLTESDVCGHLVLPSNRIIRFNITAYDPERHVLKYTISGTRGKTGESAGGGVLNTRPDSNDTWTGVKDHPENFTISSLAGQLRNCSSLAYNFELHVYGLATNGYSATPSSQRVKKEINLVISEQ